MNVKKCVLFIQVLDNTDHLNATGRPHTQTDIFSNQDLMAPGNSAAHIQQIPF